MALDNVQPTRVDKTKIWDFSSGTLRAKTPVVNTDVANKKYVDDNIGGIWGSITGTLSNQLDLQNALNDKYDTTNPSGYLAVESDPVFNAWLATTPPLYSETDPVWEAEKGNYLDRSSATQTLYVETTGSDTTGDGSVGSPFLTIQKAIDVLPYKIDHNVTIYVGAGTFSGNVTINKIADYAKYIIIKGTGFTVLEATMDCANSSREYLLVTGKTWIIDDWKGKWVKTTAGAGYSTSVIASNLYPIVSNTADTIRVAPKAVAYSATTDFQIVEHTTVITGMIMNYSSPQLLVYLADFQHSASLAFIQSVDANTQPRGIHFLQNGVSQVGFQCTGAGAISQCMAEGAMTFASFISAQVLTLSQCYAWGNTYAVSTSAPNGVLSLRGLFAENCNYGVWAFRGSLVDLITTTDVCYFENCGTVYWSQSNALIRATGPKTTITTNTKKALADSGGIIYTNNDVTATTNYDVSGQGSVIYNDTDGLELRSDLYKQTISLTDDSSVDLPDATSGMGEVIVGDNEEYAQFRYTTAGVVTLLNETANVVNTDTDTKFCIFDNGTSVRVRNRLGSTKVITINLNYK